ncbi:hypothetical protein L596_012468 [Steinernema carpocapsae]|uniref:Uncharacterized protein n=1 Tax=Steinernema carpocapsae TaxID=34508 RepID=A0A4U5NY07_STECR|nr:hypothetical protein L596_012468 [Steinernema carpocapsae]
MSSRSNKVIKTVPIAAARPKPTLFQPAVPAAPIQQPVMPTIHQSNNVEFMVGSLRQEMATLRAEQEVHKLETRKEIAALKAEIENLKSEGHEKDRRIAECESVLTAFQEWAIRDDSYTEQPKESRPVPATPKTLQAMTEQERHGLLNVFMRDAERNKAIKKLVLAGGDETIKDVDALKPAKNRRPLGNTSFRENTPEHSARPLPRNQSDSKLLQRPKKSTEISRIIGLVERRVNKSANSPRVPATPFRRNSWRRTSEPQMSTQEDGFSDLESEERPRFGLRDLPQPNRRFSARRRETGSELPSGFSDLK